ncbi:HAD-IIIC family phosphatase [uncultured Pseudodesulfovibrio sp.]|uniref:HAD-IIIC family phosphatase n=1 Tax=uncultured Pseudodesulfovibrio sp. TaxID=2035858 RepID=UPI0029C68D7C|nr:HAD-IIIC family phosphatase [uncultured Pseudodesulfovibrio sp.]
MSELIKLILVDLDNTLWEGTLLEDGLENLRLNQPLLDRLTQLDEQGVLLAVVSKNHQGDVEKALSHFGIADLFISYKASFEPKSSGVRNVLSLVRFAPSACLFVDDMAWEREEVKSAFPEIRAVSPEEFLRLGLAPEVWAYASSPEVGNIRKLSYRNQQVRNRAEEEYSGSFREFLRQSGLLVKVAPATEMSADRISELTQRTNQINFSPTRYSPEQIRQLLVSTEHKCFIATAYDRYGDYGMMGFACLRFEKSQAVIQDLMLSCRIQGKSVESAFIAVLAEKAKSFGADSLIGLYKPTRRNGQISGAYQKLGFAQVGEKGEYQQFLISLGDAALPRPEHIRVVISEKPLQEAETGLPFIRNIVKECVVAGLLKGNILDIGAGWDGVLGDDCDEFLEVNGSKHTRLDIERFPRTDIVANAQDMVEIADGTFDSALCLEVLEHCTDPFALSRELLRVLRSGGTAVVSAPMNFSIHDTPGDYWRFTPDGLKLLFKGIARVISAHVEGESDHPTRTVLILRKD